MAAKTSFLGFIIDHNEVKMDPIKINAISDWTEPKTVKDVQCFLGLASFSRKFIKDCNSLVAPLTNCLNKGHFSWDQSQAESFHLIKTKLSHTPVLALPDFNQPFEVAVDASGKGIGVVLSQNNHPIEYSS